MTIVSKPVKQTDITSLATKTEKNAIFFYLTK
jgi:hypothetical protein